MEWCLWDTIIHYNKQPQYHPLQQTTVINDDGPHTSTITWREKNR